MSDVPFRSTSGSIGCPRCSTALTKGRSAFYLHGEYVGAFESLVCPICNYSALTSKGYKEAIPQAKKIGLVGAVAETSDLPEFDEIELRMSYSTRSKNDQIINMDGKQEKETAAYFDGLLQLRPMKIQYLTKKVVVE